MGLLGFMKNVGEALFGKGKKEADAIKDLLVQQMGDRIKNLQVDFKDGVVTLSGSCDSKATKEKAVLLAGNVKGVSSVNDDQLVAPEDKEVTEFYTIQKGDTLSKIAKAYYGNAMKYPVIFEANREVIRDANLIYPGQVIRIPKL
ncbi:peptidoglycan-binding protein LysM [candidate division KSB1 bacterium]|nr:peptidoglycan-binding protein LysM [candidate division KSB1 bacterium]